MAFKKEDWKSWKAKLKNVYRFQIIDEKSYDVKLVLELSRLNILVGIGLLLAIFTVINFFFIAFTPLKQYIPGYGSSAGRKEVMNVSVKAEQLEDKLDAQQEYITNLQDILNDNITLPDTSKPKIKKAKIDTGILSIKTTDEGKFVQEVEKGLKNAELLESVQDNRVSPLSNLHIGRPVSGVIISKFSDENAYITFSAKPNEDVRAILSGNVIFTGYSVENEFYIIIQTDNQLVYILKNNSQLLKKTGNFVSVGEAVAKAGKNTLTKDKSAIVTLELWYRGQPIDAQKFIK